MEFETLQRESRGVFIFQKELHGLRLKETQDHGNLFGLWTTDGEAVIYIVRGSNCCFSESEQSHEHATDIYSNRFPLTHIGNWYYTSIHDSRRAHSDQRESARCRHAKRSDFLHLLVTPSTSLLKSVDGTEKEIVSIPRESPFRRTQRIEDGQEEHSNTELGKSNPECDCHSADFDTDDSYERKRTLPIELMQKVFIFRKDHDILVSKASRELKGTLYGLWTTDGEPVIHIVGVPNCRSLIDNRGSDLPDILSQGVPLAHIGNWRSCDSSTLPAQKKLPQIDDLRCPHETKSMIKFLEVIVWRETLQVSIKDRQINLEVLPTFESPFRYLQGARRIIIKSQNEDSFIKQATDALKHMSITGDFPIEQREIWSSPRNELFPAINRGDINIRSHSQKDPAYLRTQVYQKDFAVNRHNFKVFMFEEDYQMMVSLVLKYPNLETGGDLFGLWTTNGDAVLHVILGPGQNCKRTGASFFQDIRYLQRNGELLTEDYMLCHIGEWHSHHQMHLFQPSGGDSSTVIRNYPRGVCGFLLIIANILSSHRVELSPYLYTKTSSHSYDLKGGLIVLRFPNIFKNTRKIKENMNQGRELQANFESQHFSGYRPKSYETEKYSSKSSVKYPSRTHETSENTFQQHGHTQYFRQTPNSRRSRLQRPRHFSNRRHVILPYKASSKYSHFGKSKWNFLKSQKKRLPIWKP